MTLSPDRALLRRFEPVIRYTRGEKFFPMSVERYVRACSLWVYRPNQLPLLLVSSGELTLSRLATPRSHGPNAVYYLKFIEPLELRELAAYRLREVREEWTGKEDANVFHAGRGRLARVGYSSRFVDAIFSLSLLARGRVPGDTAAAAALQYRRMMAEEESYYYYGRVVRQNGWITLQYWFFYPFNDWRSGFYGANDHESDWEMICIYLYEDEADRLQPEWVAYASHDLAGDDLRRRWDDPELEKVGEHPVIYAGAGSHASYFQPGEYLTELELPFIAPVVNIVERVRVAWVKNVWGQVPSREWSGQSLFRVPFVDYARGDGVAIGPQQDKTWAEPCLLDADVDWISQYRGLWGLYADDPFSGENAPAGPMFNRDGRVRRSWYDPVGWAGLDKVAPPPQRLRQLQRQQAEIEARQLEISDQIEAKTAELHGLGIETAALRGQPHLQTKRTAQTRRMRELADDLNELRAQLAADEALLQALAQYAARIQAGERSPARAHIRRAHRPTGDEGEQLTRFAEIWAALSIGLMMLGFVGLIFLAPDFLLFGLMALVAVIVFVEASFRQRITQVVTSLTIGLAVVAALVLLFEFFWQIMIVLVLLAGSYITWENIRELRD